MQARSLTIFMVLALVVSAMCTVVAAQVTESGTPTKRSATRSSTRKGGAAADKKAAANEVKDDFRTVRREIQSRLRAAQPFDRASALRDLHRYPTVDAVKLLLNVGLKDDVPEVRTAAYDTLLDFKNDEGIAHFLLATVSKDTRRGAVSATTLPVLGVLLASTLPDLERDLPAYLDKQCDAHDGLALVEALADELGEHGQQEDVASLKKLAGLQAFTQEFGLRRAVVQALVKITQPDAVGLLVELLQKIKGEIRADIVQYLTEATGQTFGLEPAAWREWWKDNEKTFQFAGDVPRGGPRNFAAKGASMYYGLSIYAQKLVFIIDTSTSMTGPRIIAAKRELLQAIDGLTEDTQFSIVAFNSQVYPWQKQLVPANTPMKRAAARWVELLDVGNHTASYDALEAAMRFDAEALYFLTDGAPVGGKVTAPAEIVEVITHANYTRRLSIYSIGIGVGCREGSSTNS